MNGRPLRDDARFGGDYQKYRQAYKAWHERERTRRSKLLTLPVLDPERPTVSASADGAMPWRTHENEMVTVNDDAETVVSLDGRQRSRLPDLRSVTFQLPPDDQGRATASVAAAAVPAVPAVEDHQCSDCPPAIAAPPVPRAELVCARESIFVVPGVECLGCLLGHHTLKPVQDAIRSNAAYMDEAGVLASALRAYEQIRATCRAEGVEAPGWTTAGIRTHFWEHALDPVLEAVRMVRQLDAVQCLLMETLQGGGETPASTLRLLDQVLGEFLASYARPCTSAPAKAFKVQRTLKEAFGGAAASNVLQRSRRDDLQRFQQERSCYCSLRKGSRDACALLVDRQFEKELIAFSPAAARYYLEHGLPSLLLDLRAALQLPPGMAFRRRQADKVVVYGWCGGGRKARDASWADEEVGASGSGGGWGGGDDGAGRRDGHDPRMACGECQEREGRTDCGERELREGRSASSGTSVPCSADLQGQGSPRVPCSADLVAVAYEDEGVPTT